MLNVLSNKPVKTINVPKWPLNIPLQFDCFPVGCGTLTMKTEKDTVVFRCLRIIVTFNDLLIEGCFYGFLLERQRIPIKGFLSHKWCLQKEKGRPENQPSILQCISKEYCSQVAPQHCLCPLPPCATKIMCFELTI